MLDHWDEVCSCYEADDTYIRSYLERKLQNAKRAAVVDVGWSGNNVLQVKYLVEEAYGMDCRIHVCWQLQEMSMTLIWPG